MSPVKYELGFYISEDDILHSHRRENLKSLLPIAVYLKQNVSEMVHVFWDSVPKRRFKLESHATKSQMKSSIDTAVKTSQ
jgi:hypothetical protein